MNIRAKFLCVSATLQNHVGTDDAELVKLSAVYSENNTEDNSFSAATPSASAELLITNPDAIGVFAPGKHYYADFTCVEDAAAPVAPAEQATETAAAEEAQAGSEA
jgi:hypothetical protein